MEVRSLERGNVIRAVTRHAVGERTDEKEKIKQKRKLKVNRGGGNRWRREREGGEVEYSGRVQRVANQQQKHSSILKDSGAKLILFPRAEEREVTGRREEGETRLQKIGRLHSGGISIRNKGVLISGISAL